MERLTDKIALVTGAGQGIGRSIALRFAREGAKVLLLGRNMTMLDCVIAQAAQDNASGRLFALSCDVAREEEVERAMAACRDRFGHLDILVNNAGIGSQPGIPLHEVPASEWDQVMDVNVRGAFLILKYGIPLLMVAGGGSVINMASIGSFRARQGASPYFTSKGALLMMTRAAAMDYASHNIRVNAICPGAIETPMFAAAPQEAMDYAMRQIPQGRLGLPEEVAALALFLASDEALHITGGDYVIDGGRCAS